MRFHSPEALYAVLLRGVIVYNVQNHSLAAALKTSFHLRQAMGPKKVFLGEVAWRPWREDWGRMMSFQYELNFLIRLLRAGRHLPTIFDSCSMAWMAWMGSFLASTINDHFYSPISTTVPHPISPTPSPDPPSV